MIDNIAQIALQFKILKEHTRKGRYYGKAASTSYFFDKKIDIIYDKLSKNLTMIIIFSQNLCNQ